MEKLMKGNIIVLPFPFSDLSASKKRPALVVAILEGENIILCQITSITRKDNYSIFLNNRDFKQGKLQVDSRIRPNRLFTAARSIVLYKAGSLKSNKVKEVEKMIVQIFTK